MQHESTIAQQQEAHQLNARIPQALNDRIDLVAFKAKKAKAEIVRNALEVEVTRLEIELDIKGDKAHG